MSATNPLEKKPNDALVDPLQILLTSVPIALGSATVTEEKDQLFGVGDVTTTNVMARLPPDQVKDPSSDAIPDEKDDVQLTSADVGDNMGDI